MKEKDVPECIVLTKQIFMLLFDVKQFAKLTIFNSLLDYIGFLLFPKSNKR